MNPNSFITVRRRDASSWLAYQQEPDDLAPKEGAYPGFVALTFTRAQAIERLASMLLEPLYD